MSSPPSSVPLLHQDSALLVADKPAGLASIAERDPAQDNLHAQLQRQLGDRLWPVHRLDKDVSGAIVFARTAESHRALSLAFEQRRTRKTYVALVHGALGADSGSLDAPLRQFGSGRVGADPERGKASLTHWRVLRRLPGTGTAPAGFALLEVQPVTGRRHQIRVHLHGLGHPVAGDALYGERTQQAGFARLMLHALRLELPRLAPPAAGTADDMLVVEAPPPADFDAVLAALEPRAPDAAAGGAG